MSHFTAPSTAFLKCLIFMNREDVIIEVSNVYLSMYEGSLWSFFDMNNCSFIRIINAD